MSESVEYRDGVFVATGQAEAVDRTDVNAVTATGTALMARPSEHLAPIDAPGPLVSAELPPAGPVGPAPSSPQSAGGARRLAVLTVVAALIAAVAFGAAAFGGGFGSGSPTPGSARGALGAAAAASAGATSVAFDLSATRSTSKTTTTLVTGSGAVDLKTDVGHLAATVPALASLVGSGNDTINVISDGSAVYLGSPTLSSLTGGPKWLKVDLPQGADSGNAESSTLGILADPSQLLDLLTSLGGQVTNVGTVDLRGTQATEYTTTVTVSELASRAGLPTGSDLGTKVSKVLEQLGNTSVPITVWVGTDGYVRQITASLDLSKATLGSLASDLVNGTLGDASGQATTSTTVTVGFSHYGDPVTVAVPPADEVTDAGAIASSIKGAAKAISHAVSAFASNF